MKIKKNSYISLLLVVSLFFVVVVHPVSASEDSHRTWLKPISDLPYIFRRSDSCRAFQFDDAKSETPTR